MARKTSKARAAFPPRARLRPACRGAAATSAGERPELDKRAWASEAEEAEEAVEARTRERRARRSASGRGGGVGGEEAGMPAAVARLSSSVLPSLLLSPAEASTGPPFLLDAGTIRPLLATKRFG